MGHSPTGENFICSYAVHSASWEGENERRDGFNMGGNVRMT